jgi:CheY-like chemotaxis protein
MGGMDGIGLVTKLRSVCYPGIIIIILSADASPAEIQSYEPLGVDRILRKNVELWELRQSLSR